MNEDKNPSIPIALEMGSSVSAEVPSNVKSDFAYSKFLGTWYEIGHSDANIKGVCNKNAVLNFMANGGFSNTCYVAGKPTNSQAGTVQQHPGVLGALVLNINGKLIDFWVYDCDYTKTAIIGNGNGNIWILSRTPGISFCEFKALRDKARTAGLNVNSLNVDLDVLTGC